MNVVVFTTFIEDHGDNMCGWTNFLSKPGCIRHKAKELHRFPLKYWYLLSYQILFRCSISFFHILCQY
jgi:hypothetical protein